MGYKFYGLEGKWADCRYLGNLCMEIANCNENSFFGQEHRGKTFEIAKIFYAKISDRKDKGLILNELYQFGLALRNGISGCMPEIPSAIEIDPIRVVLTVGGTIISITKWGDIPMPHETDQI